MTWQDIARRQHGLVTTAQLATSRIDRNGVARLLRRGELRHTARRGVWCAAAAPDSPLRAAWFAVLTTGGVLSHLSAARLWRLEVPADARDTNTHVTVARNHHVRAAPGVRVHRRDDASADVIRLQGLLVTDRLRTAVDCLTVLPQATAVSVLDRWLQTRHVSLADVVRRAAVTHLRGAPQLRRIADICATGDAPSERLLHSLLRSSGIDGWRANARVGRYIADVAFYRQRLIVEVDGLAHHTSPERFQRDRTRQNALVNAGWTVLRFTWADLTTRPDYVVRSIRAALDSR